MLTKTKVIVSSVSILAVISLLPGFVTQKEKVSAIEQTTQFEVNVRDTLTVSITTPDNFATGDINTFLRNKITVDVSTNTTDGFVASMTTQTTSTALDHIADKGTIPTLASNTTRSAFPANYWGYSLNDTDAGSDSSTYSALVGYGSTPITLISNAQSSSINSRDVFFGAKADANKPSGTYMGTVIISVITGDISGNNPATPVDPAVPNPTENTPSYSTAGDTVNGSTTYTYRTSSGSGSSATTTTTTQVSDGDNRSAYSGYTPPQGVTSKMATTENVSDGSSLATGLAVTSGVAATAGTLFFILAKRKKDDEEEEEEQQQ